MKSTLFLQNVTQIDYSLLDPYYLIPMGGSYQLSVEVTGNVEQKEQVVVDFSKIKKSIKEIVDDRYFGFDHKFWIPLNFENNSDISVEEEDGELQITTPNFTMISPTNAVNFVDFKDRKTLEEFINDVIQVELRVLYPQSNITTKSFLSEDFFIPRNINDFITFRYTHGLKNSSSWGCQNINHGHLSWMAICDEEGQSIFLSKHLEDKIREFLDDAIFVFNENVCNRSPNGCQIQYDCERGAFYSLYKNCHLVYMDKETTVENITEFFIEKFKDEIKKEVPDARIIYLSEGLAKGCRLEF